MTELISVVLTTYNWPEALAASLRALLAQEDAHFEIIVADDGSDAATGALVAEFAARSRFAIRHVWQADQGFRAATIRNKAVALSRGDYLLFADGDCVALPSFIGRHRRLAEAGYFVPGNRVLLSESFTARKLKQDAPLHAMPFDYWLRQRLLGNINRLTPLLNLPDGSWRYVWARRWRKAMTCNLGVWKQDFLRVNGFDEAYQGWGFEDSDLVIRLLHAGVLRKEGRFAAPVLHLWHPLHARAAETENYQRLMRRLADADCIRSQLGVEQYLN